MVLKVASSRLDQTDVADHEPVGKQGGQQDDGDADDDEPQGVVQQIGAHGVRRPGDVLVGRAHQGVDPLLQVGGDGAAGRHQSIRAVQGRQFIVTQGKDPVGAQLTREPGQRETGPQSRSPAGMAGISPVSRSSVRS